MKTTLAILLIMVVLCSCYSRKEIQVEMVHAELIKIDTVFKYTPNQKQLLTWRDASNTEYVGYTSLASHYILGTKIMLLITR